MAVPFIRCLIISMLFGDFTLSFQFGKNCTINDRLMCSVEEGSCAANPTVVSTKETPSAPYDVRVHQALAAVPSREPNSYQLWVNISWHPPYDQSIGKVRGFELTIVDKENDKQWCFTFRLNETSRLEDKDRSSLPKFRFWTKDVFEFGRKYYIEVQSLPKSSSNGSSSRANYVYVEVTMAEHPGISTLTGNIAAVLQKGLESTGWFEVASPDGAVNCTHFAHPDANKWIAAFRYIVVKPWPKQIFVDFIAAPPQYCFEAYELRLLKGRHSIISSTIVTKDDLYDELYGNITVMFGNFTFENVAPGLYDIAIVPIDRAVSGRCLCPLPSKICTCSQAIWSDVELKDAALKKPDDPCSYLPPIRDPFLCRNLSIPTTSIAPGPRGNELTSNGVLLMIILIVLSLVVIIVGVLVLRLLYRKYKAKDIALYMMPVDSVSGFTSTTTTMSESASQNFIRPTRVLVVYSHDCSVHDEAVQAFVAYLQVKCKCDVSVDYLCRREIAENKFDWLHQSMKLADKVLFIVSYGSFVRYQARLLGGEEPVSVERKEALEFDDLFLLQLDLFAANYCLGANGGDYSSTAECRRKFVAVRLEYTPAECALPHFETYCRYEIPKHLKSLVCHLHNLSENVDVAEFRYVNRDDFGSRSSEGVRLRKSLTEMAEYARDKKDWFEKLHVRKCRKTTSKVDQIDPKANPSLNVDLFDNDEEKISGQFVDDDQKLIFAPMCSPLLPKVNGHCLASSYEEAEQGRQVQELATGDELKCRNMESRDSGIGVDLNNGGAISSMYNTPTSKRKLTNDDEQRRLLLS